MTSRPVTVLVVDDDPRVRAGIRETIAAEADLWLVGEAADAATALALASAQDPAVALVDVRLGANGVAGNEGNGLDVVRALSRRAGCAVIAMSARSATRDAALTAGAIVFVEKGGDIDGLLDAIRDVAARDG